MIARFRKDISKSSSDFIKELLDTFKTNTNTIVFKDDFIIPTIWYTIEENRNDQLYVSIIDHNNVIITDNNETEYKQHYIKIIIESQNYTEETLLSEIITKLNIELGNLLGYTAGEIASGNVPNFSGNYNSDKKIYEIKLGDSDLVGSPTYSFKILTNQETTNIYNIELKTCNEIKGKHKNNKTIINEILYTGIINIEPLDTIYLNCNELYNQDIIIVNDITHPTIKKINIKTKNYNHNNSF